MPPPSWTAAGSRPRPSPPAGNTVEVAPSLLWTITVTDGGVTLTDSKGQIIAPKGGDANGIKSGSYTWTGRMFRRHLYLRRPEH